MSIPQQLAKPNYRLEGFSFYANTEQPAHYHEHSHDELEIALLLNQASARVKWSVGGKSQVQDIDANQLCIIPSQQPHTMCWEKSAEYILIFIHPSLLMETAYDWLQNDTDQFNGRYAISDSLIHSLALTMRSAFQAQEYIDYLYIDSLVNVLVMYLHKAHLSYRQMDFDTGEYPRRWLRQTLDYIHASLDQDLRLAKLADIAQMSESNFCHLFRRHMGTPPHQYVIRQRIERAKVLLQRRKLPIIEIAYECGFNSQSHLTICFRQHTGMTPKAYQSSYWGTNIAESTFNKTKNIA